MATSGSENENQAGPIAKHRAQLSQSVNAGQRTSKQSLVEGGGARSNPADLNPQVRIRNKYY